MLSRLQSKPQRAGVLIWNTQQVKGSRHTAGGTYGAVCFLQMLCSTPLCVGGKGLEKPEKYLVGRNGIHIRISGLSWGIQNSLLEAVLTSQQFSSAVDPGLIEMRPNVTLACKRRKIQWVQGVKFSLFVLSTRKVRAWTRILPFAFIIWYVDVSIPTSLGLGASKQCGILHRACMGFCTAFPLLL